MGIAGFMIWFVKNFGASVSTLDVKRSNNPPNAQTPPAQPPPRQQPHITCDYLYLDLNGFVHNRARQARYFVAHRALLFSDRMSHKTLCLNLNPIPSDETHLVFRIFSQIDTMMRLCNPRKAVYLCLDGPASSAKLNEQRKRRQHKVLLKSLVGWIIRNRNNCVIVQANSDDKKKAAPKKKKGGAFDSLQLTPGTEFMVSAVHSSFLR